MLALLQSLMVGRAAVTDQNTDTEMQSQWDYSYSFCRRLHPAPTLHIVLIESGGKCKMLKYFYVVRTKPGPPGGWWWCCWRMCRWVLWCGVECCGGDHSQCQVQLGWDQCPVSEEQCPETSETGASSEWRLPSNSNSSHTRHHCHAEISVNNFSKSMHSLPRLDRMWIKISKFESEKKWLMYKYISIWYIIIIKVDTKTGQQWHQLEALNKHIM